MCYSIRYKQNGAVREILNGKVGHRKRPQSETDGFETLVKAPMKIHRVIKVFSYPKYLQH